MRRQSDPARNPASRLIGPLWPWRSCPTPPPPYRPLASRRQTWQQTGRRPRRGSSAEPLPLCLWLAGGTFSSASSLLPCNSSRSKRNQTLNVKKMFLAFHVKSEALYSYSYKLGRRCRHLLGLFVLLPQAEGAGQAATFDLVDQPFADQLRQSLPDVGAILQEVVSIGGPYVGEDGVVGGPFARSHLLDRGEEHDTHGCKKRNKGN